jgi:hypothetical protein
MHDISFKEYLKIEESSLIEVSMTDISKGLSTAINVPENIVAVLYKAFRVMKATAFLAALIYMGFRIEAVRALFPWLAPFIDKAGAAVLAMGSGFLEQSFSKLSSLFPELVDWLSDKIGAKAIFKAGEEAYQLNKKVIGPSYRPYSGPTGKF